ncbi:MAG: serine protease, partial [Cryptosporangiaceae bacterium]|nr:serine protease [Cryptosporangiaceae bacterium]
MPARAMPRAVISAARALAAVLLAVVGLLAVPASPAQAADAIRRDQWQLGFLRAADAWRLSTGAGMTVAVIDSGVDANHPDLRGQVLPGADFVDGTTDGRTDFVGHGTTVAALIAGRGDDDSGVKGLAFGAKILPVRVLDKENRYESGEVVARAVHWAVDHGAQVINLSLGSADAAPALSEAMQYAFSKDVVVVACDGNLSNKRGTLVWHPAREPGVIAVSGVTQQGRFWDGSLQGPATVLSAPASNITGAHPGGDYWNVQGTSFASPLVAASAALVRSRFRGISAPNVVNRLVQSAWDFGTPGRDPQFGFGIVNPSRALADGYKTVRANPLLRATSAGSSAGQVPAGGAAQPGAPNGAGDPQSIGPAGTIPFLSRSVYVLGSMLAVVLLMIAVALVLGAMMMSRRSPRIRVLEPIGAGGVMLSGGRSGDRRPPARAASRSGPRKRDEDPDTATQAAELTAELHAGRAQETPSERPTDRRGARHTQEAAKLRGTWRKAARKKFPVTPETENTQEVPTAKVLPLRPAADPVAPAAETPVVPPAAEGAAAVGSAEVPVGKPARGSAAVPARPVEDVVETPTVEIPDVPSGVAEPAGDEPVSGAAVSGGNVAAGEPGSEDDEELVRALRAERELAELVRAEKAERAEAARVRAEQLAAEEAEKAAVAQAAKERAEQAERERLDRERAEKARLDRERAEREKVEKEHAEREKIARAEAKRAQAEQKRAERDRRKNERAEAKRIKSERVKAGRAEAQRIKSEQVAA